MKKLTAIEQKMFDWDNELRFYSTAYSDAQVIEVAQKAIDFAYANFKTKETVFEGFDFQYESHIENIALGLDAHLQKNKNNRKSKLIQDFILRIIHTEKYGKGRSGFIFLLYILKMDLALKQIARDRLDFWQQPRIRFQLLYALYRRKIEGFTKEAEKLIEDYPQETYLKKYANKYLEQQRKLSDQTV